MLIRLWVTKVPQSFRAESSELKQNAPFSQEAGHHGLVSALPRVYVQLLTTICQDYLEYSALILEIDAAVLKHPEEPSGSFIVG